MPLQVVCAAFEADQIVFELFALAVLIDDGDLRSNEQYKRLFAIGSVNREDGHSCEGLFRPQHGDDREIGGKSIGKDLFESENLKYSKANKRTSHTSDVATVTMAPLLIVYAGALCCR